MKDSIRFVVKVVKETLKETKKSLFIGILVAIATWIIHTYILVVLNEGFGSSEIFFSSLLNLSGIQPLMPLIYMMLGYVFSSFLLFFRYGKSTNPIKNLFYRKDAMVEALKSIKTKDNSSTSLMIALSIAFLLEAYMPKAGSIMLGFLLSGAVVKYRAKNSSLLLSFLKVFFRDLKGLLKEKEEPSYKELDFYITIVSVFLIILSSYRLFNYVSKRTMLAIGIALYVLTRLKNKPSSSSTGSLFIVFVSIIALAKLLYPDLVLADDGGLTEAGGTFRGWVESPGAFRAVLQGLIPALSALLGALLSYASLGWNLPLDSILTFPDGFESDVESDVEEEENDEVQDELNGDEDLQDFKEPLDNLKEEQEKLNKEKEQNNLKKEQEEEARKRQERADRIYDKILVENSLLVSPSGKIRDFSTPRGQAILRKLKRAEQAVDAHAAGQWKDKAKEWEKGIGRLETIKHVADTANDILEKSTGPIGTKINWTYKTLKNIFQDVGDGIVKRKETNLSNLVIDSFSGLAKTGMDFMEGQVLSKDTSFSDKFLSGKELKKAIAKKFGKTVAVKTSTDLAKAKLDNLVRGDKLEAKDYAMILGKNSLFAGIDVGMDGFNNFLDNSTRSELLGKIYIGRQTGSSYKKLSKIQKRMLEDLEIEKQMFEPFKKLAEIGVSTTEKKLKGDFTGKN